MLKLNSTLIVQAVHFFIAYCVIRWVIFKPAVAVVMHEDALFTSLRSDVAERQSTIEQKNHELATHWSSCKLYFARHAPKDGIARPVPQATSYIDVIPISQKDIDIRVKETAVVLVDKVVHVR